MTAVKNLRIRYPLWGKDKLVILLKQEGWDTSVSTVGCILTDLKKRGQLVEPERKAISVKRKVKRFYAIRGHIRLTTGTLKPYNIVIFFTY